MLKLIQNPIFQKNRNLIIFITAALITVLIVMISWFRTGAIISNSEESLSIYSPQKSYSLNVSVWFPGEIGSRVPFGINRAYPFLVLSASNIGVPTFINQAILIGFTIFAGLVSAYLLFNYLSKGNFFVSVFASFFYAFNLYTQTQIYRRFLYNFMFAFAYLPLFLFLLIRSLESQSWKYLLFLAGSSVLFSFSFNHPATIFTFGVTALIVFLFQLKKEATSIKRILLFLRFTLITILLCVLVNLWWIYPFLASSGDYSASITNTAESDLNLLKGVSGYMPIQQISLLRQSWWYGESQHWYGFYSNSLTYLLSILILLTVIYGIFKAKNYKGLFLTLLLIGLFISKGSNPPLGETFFKYLFGFFPFTGALRNPYEKFGIVFVLPYVYFFSLGLFYLSNRLKNFKRQVFTVISTILVLGILVWPIWTGDVFLKQERMYVPEYYQQANSYLNQKGDLRIFHLPLSKTYDAVYSWGFRGQDPSEYLFDRTSLSNTFTPPLGRDFYPRLPELAKNKDFSKLLGVLGVGDIVVHNEAKITQDTLITPEVLSNWDNFEKVTKFGDLNIYELNKEIVRPRFYSLSNFSSSSFPDDKILDDKFSPLRYTKTGINSYSVEMENSDQATYLIFNEKFDKGWQAFIDSNALKHFKVYDLFNGWVVDQRGSFSINVNFRP